jgi:hypothetical protein
MLCLENGYRDLPFRMPAVLARRLDMRVGRERTKKVTVRSDILRL